MTRIQIDAPHGIEHEDRDFGPCRIAGQRDARDSGSDGRAADVPRSSFVQCLRDHVIMATLAGAKFRVTSPELGVDLQHELFQHVFHPAIGNGALSRL